MIISCVYNYLAVGKTLASKQQINSEPKLRVDITSASACTLQYLFRHPKKQSRPRGHRCRRC